MSSYGAVAEQAWGWVQQQVQWDDDGPWTPESAGGDLARMDNWWALRR